MTTSLTIIPIRNIKNIKSKDSIADIIYSALQKQDLNLQAGDIIVITQKIISKAEGRIINLKTIIPSEFARQIAIKANKDPRHIEVVLQQTKRIVRMDHNVLICETKQGFICANAGVDASNLDDSEILSILPEDPDRSADDIRKKLIYLNGQHLKLAVIITDTWGRPWREGQVNNAIGVSGMQAICDYRGKQDTNGQFLQATIIAAADELAAAAELVMGKTEKVPVALIRGYNFISANKTGQDLIRSANTDMFR